MRSLFSKTVTQWPARASCCAAARPAGPDPTTATRVAEGHAAIHAAGALRLHLVEREFLVDLEPVVDALFYRPALRQLARVLHEPRVFTHAQLPSDARRPTLVYIRAGRFLRTWTE